MTEDIKPEDRVLDWCSGHDPRSRNFSFYDLDLKPVERKPFRWQHGQVLNQGKEGACTGYAMAGELLASPYPFRTSYNEAQAAAQALYHRARAFDRAKGYNWPEGASVTAAAQAVVERGHFKSYRWCFSIDEFLDALRTGPVVVGTDWLDGMYYTRPSGLVEVTGRKVGGHSYFFVGHHPSMRLAGEDWSKRFNVVVGIQSWGDGYGKKGVFYMRVEDLDNLLARRGEACVPMHRQKIVRL